MIETGGQGDNSKDRVKYNKIVSNKSKLKVITCKEKAPDAPPHWKQKQRVLFTTGPQERLKTLIPAHPLHILEAPILEDDFYRSILDWSSSNNIILAFGPDVYIWNASSGQADLIASFESSISSLAWSPDPSYVAIATDRGEITVWRVRYTVDSGQIQSTRVRVLNKSGVSCPCMCWNRSILSVGDANGMIMHHDVSKKESLLYKFKAHEQSVVGLKWNADGTILASGSNDNMVCIWNGVDACEASLVFNHHRGAVRGLSWSPHASVLLASAGGLTDRCIHIWNVRTGEIVQTIETNSQITSLLFSPHENEIVVGHGYPDNALCVYDVETGKCLADLRHHLNRVLHISLAPDGKNVASAGGDSLCFWKIFGRSGKDQDGDALGCLQRTWKA